MPRRVDPFGTIGDLLAGGATDDDLSYEDVASAVMWPFVAGTIDRPSVFERLVADAYAGFDDPAVCPLVRLDDRRWLLELFHGPTMAFKDVALQVVGRLFDHYLAVRGARATILVATSGDTGSAAMAASAGRGALDCIVLYPEGRPSEVQRRQMTTIDAPNVHALSVEGTFDDCQDLVKAAFADRAFRDEVALSAMNSINWGRVMAQVVYYVTAARALRRAGEGDPADLLGADGELRQRARRLGRTRRWAWRWAGSSSPPTPTTCSPAGCATGR